MGWPGVTADRQGNWADRLIFTGSETLAQKSSSQAKLAVGREPHGALIQPMSHGQRFHQQQKRSFLMTPIIGSLQDQTHTLLLAQPTCSVQEYSYAQWALNLQSSQNLIWFLALSKNSNVLWIPFCTGEPNLTQMLAVAHFWQLVACSKHALLPWGARLGSILLTPITRHSSYSQKSTGIAHCRKCYLS